MSHAVELTYDIIPTGIVDEGMTAIEARRWIKAINPRTNICLISSEVSNDYITLGIKSGTGGLVVLSGNS